MGLVTLTFDLLTLKLVRESHQRWEPSFQIWARELFAMYATDGRTDKSYAYCPLPYGWGHNIIHNGPGDLDL